MQPKIEVKFRESFLLNIILGIIYTEMRRTIWVKTSPIHSIHAKHFRSGIYRFKWVVRKSDRKNEEASEIIPQKRCFSFVIRRSIKTNSNTFKLPLPVTCWNQTRKSNICSEKSYQWIWNTTEDKNNFKVHNRYALTEQSGQKSMQIKIFYRTIYSRLNQKLFCMELENLKLMEKLYSSDSKFYTIVVSFFEVWIKSKWIKQIKQYVIETKSSQSTFIIGISGLQFWLANDVLGIIELSTRSLVENTSVFSVVFEISSKCLRNYDQYVKRFHTRLEKRNRTARKHSRAAHQQNCLSQRPVLLKFEVIR